MDPNVPDRIPEVRPEEVIEKQIAEALAEEGEIYRIKVHWLHYRWPTLFLALALLVGYWFQQSKPRSEYLGRLFLALGVVAALLWLYFLLQASWAKRTAGLEEVFLDIQYLPGIKWSFADVEGLSPHEDVEHRSEVGRIVNVSLAGGWWKKFIGARDVFLVLEVDRPNVRLSWVRKPRLVARQIEEFRRIRGLRQEVLESINAEDQAWVDGRIDLLLTKLTERDTAHDKLLRNLLVELRARRGSAGG